MVDRRRFILCGNVAIAMLVSGLQAQNGAKVYERDIRFLFDELPKKAGHFFAVKGIDWKKVETEFKAATKEVKSDGDHVL